MKILLIAIGFFAFALSRQGFSQTAVNEMSFSLEEAQAYALQHNPNVQNARLDVDAAKKRIWENAAMGLPQLSASAGYNNNLQLMTTLIPAEFFGGEPGTYQPVQFGTQHNATANVVASQLLFSGPYIVGLQAASKYKELNERTLVKTQSDIQEAVAQSYFSILLAEAGKEAMARNLENMRERLSETRAFFETGFVEETDVDQIRIAVATLENEYNAAEKLARLSYRMLLYQMGLDLDARITISQTLDEIIEDLTTNLLQQEFIAEDHIDYKIMNSQEQLAYLQVKRNQYEFMPTLTASLNHSQMAMRNQFNFYDFDGKWYPSTLLGFNLNIPLFSSGMRTAKVGQAKVELEKAKNLKSGVVSGLELEVHRARIDFGTAYAKYLNEKNNIELAQKVFDRTSIKYSNGMAGSFDLTIASEQLTGVQTGYISAVVELLTAKLKLEKALGQL